jgi:hypothetical protein
MSPNTRQRQSTLRAGLLLALGAMLAGPCAAGPFDTFSSSEKLTAVYSTAHNGYVRTLQADGSYKPETFAFGDGGVLEPGISDQYSRVDPTIDNLSFDAIARMLAGPLASRNYVAARDPRSTNLLIVVYWGTTIGGVNTRDGALRDYINYNNAKLLGFDSEGFIKDMVDPSTVFYGRNFMERLLSEVHSDVLSAVEVNRYYVILRAFDFQAAWKHKERRLLWETRFSLSERRHDFERDLPAMAQDAALYFGKDTYGLVFRPIPEGQVHVGEVTTVKDALDGDDQGVFDSKSGAAGDWERSSPGTKIFLHIDASGNAVFENPGRHVTLSARATTNEDVVTVRVPGWGLVIQGTLRGDRISGMIVQYNKRDPVTLRRVAKPIEGAGSK